MIRDYNEKHCWQYNIRQKNLAEDLSISGLRYEDVEKLKVGDFVLLYEEKDVCYDDVKHFIERHEWLGRMSLYPTHIYLRQDIMVF